MSVKCEPDLAVALRDSYPAIRPGYHLNKRHWNTIAVAAACRTSSCATSSRTPTTWWSARCRGRVRDELGWAPE